MQYGRHETSVTIPEFNVAVGREIGGGVVKGMGYIVENQLLQYSQTLRTTQC